MLAVKNKEIEKEVILDSLLEHLVLQDTGHKVLWANKAASETIGLPLEKIVGRNCFEIWARRDKPCTGCPVERAHETGRPQEMEMTTPDGRVWLIRGYPIKKINDRFTELVEVVQEITQSKQSETALIEAEEKYGTLVENSLTGIYIIDQDGKIAFANNKFVETYRYSKNEIIGIESWRLVHPEHRPLTEKIKEKRLLGEEAPSEYEAKGLTKDGETIWVLRRNTCIEYKGSKAILGNIVDITERKRAEEELRNTRDMLEHRVRERTAELKHANELLQYEINERESIEKDLRASEEKYRFLFDYDPNPLFRVDAASTMILDANKQAGIKYQYSSQELSDMSFLNLLDPEHADQLWEELHSVAQKEREVILPRIETRKKDGHHFFIDLHARITEFQKKWKSSGPFYIIRTVDITRRLEQEAQIAHVGIMTTLGEMATGIAHELNQPLNVIRLGSDIFAKSIEKKKKISEDKLLKVSRNICCQVDRAAKIIDHLREFGCKNASRSYPLDLNESILAVFSFLGSQLKSRGIEVDLQLDEGLPKILASKNLLEQIFLNLVTNAREAMEAKGPGTEKRLTITTHEEEGKVVVLVSDTGPGIPDQIFKKIFDPFFTTKEVGKGTGLGLSIVYRIVKDFGGDISVKSTSDTGTIFELSFPISDLLNPKL
ncbi:MAG: PAS domain S-box protein [Proteobacteria bacterium]|nr:PAS domain S-box protein [Pseudomonadota bacterium]MBU4298411.1 PAS domain S-box protein [Pseudomonadota bacterium]MCG2747443.1 PAS domain S-box protein [Desulfobulbaceae bacterium]